MTTIKNERISSISLNNGMVYAIRCETLSLSCMKHVANNKRCDAWCTKLSQIYICVKRKYSWLCCWFDIIFIIFDACVFIIYHGMFCINHASLRFLVFLIFWIWRRKTWRLYIWFSKSNNKLLFTKLVCNWWYLMKYNQQHTWITILLLLLLNQIYNLHVFLLQIQKIKNTKKRSDAWLIQNIPWYIMNTHASKIINIISNQQHNQLYFRLTQMYIWLSLAYHASHLYCYVVLIMTIDSAKALNEFEQLFKLEIKLINGILCCRLMHLIASRLWNLFSFVPNVNL